jgi:hypothetical protein
MSTPEGVISEGEWPLARRVWGRYARSPGVVASEGVLGIIRRATQLSGRLPLLDILAHRRASGDRPTTGPVLVYAYRLGESPAHSGDDSAAGTTIEPPAGSAAPPLAEMGARVQARRITGGEEPAPSAAATAVSGDAGTPPHQMAPVASETPRPVRVTLSPASRPAEVARFLDVAAPAGEAAPRSPQPPAPGTPAVTQRAPAQVVQTSPEPLPVATPTRGRIAQPVALPEGVRTSGLAHAVRPVIARSPASPPESPPPPVVSTPQQPVLHVAPVRIETAPARPATVARAINLTETGAVRPTVTTAPAPPPSEPMSPPLALARPLVIQRRVAPDAGPVVEARPARQGAVPDAVPVVVSAQAAPLVRRTPDAPTGQADSGPALVQTVVEPQVALPIRSAEGPAVTVDVSRVADQVYGMLVRRLANERQRRGV